MFTHIFAANLLRKLCTKFHQNHLSFIEDITKKHFGLVSSPAKGSIGNAASSYQGPRPPSVFLHFIRAS